MKTNIDKIDEADISVAVEGLRKKGYHVQLSATKEAECIKVSNAPEVQTEDEEWIGDILNQLPQGGES